MILDADGEIMLGDERIDGELAVVEAREAERLDLSFRSVAIRDPRTRWGSCSGRGNLSFSWRLAAAPPEVLDYVVVHDAAGKEVARSRLVFRDPYKRPYSLRLLVNTQIPPGESREHRVPISVASGTVRCELHFKFYYPIEGPRGEYGCFVRSDGSSKPARVHMRDPSFVNLQAADEMSRGHLVADVIAVVASIDPVMGGVDR